MKKTILLLHTLLIHLLLFSQNVGIGTNTPRFPLSFAPQLGQKITLWDDGNAGGGNYGIGIQSGLLQIHSYSIADDIVLGYGSSGNFTERFRFRGNGNMGVGVTNPQQKMDINGRILLRHEGGANTAGLWLGNSSNTGTPGFIGLSNNNTMGFYGSLAGWSFNMNTNNGNIGIGTSTPQSRLDLSGSNSWDLINTEGDMRIGNNNYRMKFGVALDGGGAGAASIMQYGQAGGFNNLALGSQGKYFLQINGSGNYIDITNASGGVRISGNAGQPGQALVSNGPGSEPSWSPSTRFIYENSVKKISTSFANVGGSGNPTTIVIPNLSHTFTVSGHVMAMISWSFNTYSNSCAFCGDISLFTAINLNGNLIHQLDENIPNGTRRTTSGSTIVFLNPGTYTVDVLARNFSSNIVATVGGNGAGVTPNMTVVLFPF